MLTAYKADYMPITNNFFDVDKKIVLKY